ncbi:MAG: hypothetical protein Q4F41_14150 [Eubacteriales bacterium]|nr:hypothetical protein [Eubacteriales bacterium]
MVDIPKEIEQYGFRIETEPHEVEKTVGRNLIILAEQCEKLLDCYEMYASSTEERFRDVALEAMNSYLNHITQAFRDIMAYILINDGASAYSESLSFYVAKYFTLDINCTPEAEKAVNFLNRRNDLVHDYFNISKRNYELARAVASYGEGFRQMAESLKEYCYLHYTGLKMDDDIKKTISGRKPKTK